ncbi:MAG: YfhO family protein [Chitinivibrionales bacterium]|nr:YfhO family protein [Chitinivibrionales bacterium]MBD3357678.1 YfhO family protein [Chitinivibrionales bacterium]
MTKRKSQKAEHRNRQQPEPRIADNRTGLGDRYYLSALAAAWILFYHRILLGQASFWEDLVRQEFPHRLFVRESLLNLRFPHWNPFVFGGMPFFSALHTGVMYPFNLIMSFIPAGHETYWYFLQVMIILHLLFAGICMYYFCRSRHISRGSSFIGALGYMLCGFFITQVIHSLMLYIIAWLPLIMMLLEQALRRRRFTLAIAGGLILGLTIFAGHPQITFYEFLFLGAFTIYVWFDKQDRQWRDFAIPLVLFTIAVGLSLVQILPTVELSEQSGRIGWTFLEASEGSLSFRQLLTFLVPKIFGAWTGARTGSAARIPPFWLKDSPNSGYYTYWETCFYTGIAVLILGFLYLRLIKKSRFAQFFALWCGLSLAVALGNHFFVYRLLFDFVPGFGTFRIPARILFTWNLLLPVAAATTLDKINDPTLSKDYRRPILIAAAACTTFGLLIGLGLMQTFWPELTNSRLASFAAKQGWLLSLNAGLVLLVFGLYYGNRLPSRFLRPAVAGILALDLLVFGWGQHMINDQGAPQHFRENHQIARSLKDESQDEQFRANMRQFILEPDVVINRKGGLMILKKNQGAIDRVELIEGYNPLQLYRRLPPLKSDNFQALLDLLNVKYYVDPGFRPGNPAQQNPLRLNPTYMPRARFFYRATVLESDSAVKKRMLEGSFDHRRELLLSEKPSITLPPPGDDASPPSNHVEILSYEPNRIEIEAQTQENGLLWLSEIWYPAWKAYINGESTKIHRADYSFRAIEIPAGKHRVEFVYRSKYFRLGALLSLLTLTAAVGGLVWCKMKSPKSSPPHSNSHKHN